VSVQDITDVDFAKLIGESDIPVVVDFWASWCGPCRKVSPVVSELAEEWAGRAKVVKVNIDDAPETTMAEKVMGIPLIAVYKNGERVVELTGTAPKATIKTVVESQL